MPKVKVLLTKIEEVRRVEKVEYLATVNVSNKVKNVKNYLKKELTENGNIDVVDNEVFSVEIVESDMIDEKTENFIINPDKTKLVKRNKVTYL